jgi:hypothetical protein
MKQIILLVFLLLSPVTQAEEDDWWQHYDRTKTIHLQFSDTVKDGYTVNVSWNPDGGLAPMLTGPALINFKSNAKFGTGSYSVKAGYFHIPNRMLVDAGLIIFGENGKFDLSVDLSKTYKIKYNSKLFKKISLLDNTHEGFNVTDFLNDNYDHNAPGSWEQIPFFFEDVDFDGVEELIVTDFNSGQRGGNEYSIHKYFERYGKINYKNQSDEPFGYIDQLTTFDKDSKTIAQFHSGGSCANSEDIYKIMGSKFERIQYKKWHQSASMIMNYVCTESTFDIVDGREVLKSESDDYYDDDKHKWIEVCDENAATQSKSYLEFVMRNEVCLAGGLLE